MERDKNFYYTETNSAAWLCLQEFELDRLEYDEERNKVVFVFLKTDKLLEAVREFKSNALLQVYMVKHGNVSYQARDYRRNMNNNQ